MTDEPLYEEGFNSGYLLEQLRPDLAELFGLMKSDDDYLQGLQDGRQEKLLEPSLDKDLEELDDLRSQGKNAPEQDR